MDLMLLTESSDDLQLMIQKARKKEKLFGFPFYVVQKKGEEKYILLAGELFQKWSDNKQDEYIRHYPEMRK